MRIAYFDIISGICGDMTLGAFVHAGVPIGTLKSELGRLNLTGYSISERRIERSKISATKVDVMVNNAHDGHHHHAHHHEGHHHRSYTDIIRLIESSDLPSKVVQTSKDIFTTIGIAEAAVHNTTLDDIHFHEVGAVDSIVDIVGSAICLDCLGIEAVFSSPVPLGSNGTVNTQHGIMPIPAPATVEILKDYPVVLKDVRHELTTPTGAAIIKTLSAGTLNSTAQIRLKSIGYGAGSDDISGMPNLLRLLIGDMDIPVHDETLLHIETNIDDMNPQLYPYLMERVLSLGANDMYITPVLMKKGRPGHVVSILCSEAQREDILRLLYTETTTIGVRMSQVHRSVLPRESFVVETALGPVNAKRINVLGRIRLAPEFEDCKRLAAEHGLPLSDVYARVEKALED